MPLEMDEAEARERVRALMETRPSARPADFVNPLEKIEQLLTCPICLDRYKCPKLLPCQHTFCLPCIEGCAESSVRMLKCPECRAEHSIPFEGVKSFQTNYTLTGFLDIHLQATSDTSAQLEEYIHRFNLERCKICDEKAECDSCAHCDRRACKECRSAHMDMVKRDLSRLLNQVKRLSNRIIEASDGVAKGVELLTLNCETTKTEVKEYFHRYQRELKKREESLLSEIEQFFTTESRLMKNLRDILEIESSNMSEGVARLDAALKGECTIDDAELVRYKNTFSEGLEYLRNFQPDADELFCKKLRFAPGDDASKLPQAISSFGELCVLVPQFAGRYMPLEQSYLPRPIRIGLESDYRRRGGDDDGYRGLRYSRKDEIDESSLRYRRRQALEDEAWARLHGCSTLGAGRDSAASSSVPGASPWSRSPQPPATDQSASSSDGPPSPSKSPLPSIIKPPTPPQNAAPKRQPAVSPAGKPPLPRQRSSTEDASLNEKVETIRRAHKEKRHSYLGPATEAADSSEGDSPVEEAAAAASTPTRARIRIICRSSSVSRADDIPTRLATSMTSTDLAATSTPPSTEESETDRGTPLPIQHFPGEEEGGGGAQSGSSPALGDPVSVPTWLARRRMRYQRSKTNPDIAAALAGSSISPRVQKLLAERSSRLDNSTAIRVGAPPPMLGDDGEAIDGAAGDSAARARGARHRRASLTREAAEYRSRGLPLKVFGRKGAKEGELNWPRGLAPLPGGLLAVADSSNHRICFFSASDGKFVRALGEYGTGAGQLDSAAGVAGGRGRQLVVTDRYNHRVVIYDAEGNVAHSFGGHGPSNGRFNNPWGVAVDEAGTIYVVDKDNHRVQMFDKHGAFLGKFGSMGHAEGQFNNPLFIAVNKITHEVFVTDSSNNRVCVFDNHGGFKLSFGEEGFQAGQFKLPRGIAIDQKGNVIIADSGNNRIQVFTAAGEFIATFGSWGAGAGQLKGVEAVAVLPDGGIAVSDRDNHRIQIFS